MRSPGASAEYRDKETRLLLAVFGPPITLATLMFVIAVIAQLARIAALL